MASSFSRKACPLALLASLVLALAWIDILPGGWTLRGWLLPHAVRAARAQAEHSERRLLAFAAENAAAPEGTTVWLGSSTIERFPVQELFPSLTSLNRGIGGESAPQLLDRIERSLPGAKPARLIFYVGSIDLRYRRRSPERIAALARSVIEAALEPWEGEPPQVIVLGILPDQEMLPAAVERLERTNAALEELCRARAWRFVPTARPPLATPDGSLAAGYAADDLHLSRKGYEVLRLWLGLEGGSRGASH